MNIGTSPNDSGYVPVHAWHCMLLALARVFVRGELTVPPYLWTFRHVHPLNGLPAASVYQPGEKRIGGLMITTESHGRKITLLLVRYKNRAYQK